MSKAGEWAESLTFEFRLVCFEWTVARYNMSHYSQIKWDFSFIKQHNCTETVHAEIVFGEISADPCSTPAELLSVIFQGLLSLPCLVGLAGKPELRFSPTLKTGLRRDGSCMPPPPLPLQWESVSVGQNVHMG